MQRYVMYVAGLEALLLKEDEREGISQKLSYRVAFLLGPKPENREKLFRKIRDLYELRSDIVHGDFVNIVKVKGYLPYIHWLLYSIVKRLVTGPEHFTSFGDVVDWVRRRSLGFD